MSDSSPSLGLQNSLVSRWRGDCGFRQDFHWWTTGKKCWSYSRYQSAIIKVNLLLIIIWRKVLNTLCTILVFQNQHQNKCVRFVFWMAVLDVNQIENRKKSYFFFKWSSLILEDKHIKINKVVPQLQCILI